MTLDTNNLALPTLLVTNITKCRRQIRWSWWIAPPRLSWENRLKYKLAAQASAFFVKLLAAITCASSLYFGPVLHQPLKSPLEETTT